MDVIEGFLYQDRYPGESREMWLAETSKVLIRPEKDIKRT